MNERLNTNHGPLHPIYMARIKETISRALNEHPRTLAIRVDLRLPTVGEDPDTLTNLANSDSHVISRFFDSLKAQIDADVARKKRGGIRTFECSLRYIWVKEKNKEHNDHYHVLLLLNKDTYHRLGSYSSSESNLAMRISRALTSALGIDNDVFSSLTHFPENPLYFLNRNAAPLEFQNMLSQLLYRASYLAKKETKQYGDGFRSFSCSRR